MRRARSGGHLRRHASQALDGEVPGQNVFHLLVIAGLQLVDVRLLDVRHAAAR